MTAACESWMAVLRKYCPKRFHFARYYNMGMWMAIVTDAAEAQQMMMVARGTDAAVAQTVEAMIATLEKEQRA